MFVRVQFACLFACECVRARACSSCVSLCASVRARVRSLPAGVNTEQFVTFRPPPVRQVHRAMAQLPAADHAHDIDRAISTIVDKLDGALAEENEIQARIAARLYLARLAENVLDLLEYNRRRSVFALHVYRRWGRKWERRYLPFVYGVFLWWGAWWPKIVEDEEEVWELLTR